jgi:hypothetical protein
MKYIYKEYDKPFLLEPTKLNRLLDTIHERLADYPQANVQDSFQAFLSGDRREEMTKVEDVLALDNSRKHRIRRLLIVCSASTPGATRPEHEVQVDFGAPKAATHEGSGKKTVVAITVRSDKANWANRTLSEVEEQVERTWLVYTQVALILVAVLLFLLFAFGVVLEPAKPKGQVGQRTMWLQNSDLDRVEALVRDQRIVTDQELREMVTRQLRNVLEAERPPQSTAKSETRQVLFIAIPAVAILGCVFILAFSYPMTVFLWGDAVAWYEALLQRRKIVWGFIVGILAVGLLSRFLAEGVLSLFSGK